MGKGRGRTSREPREDIDFAAAMAREGDVTPLQADHRHTKASGRASSPPAPRPAPPPPDTQRQQIDSLKRQLGARTKALLEAQGEINQLQAKLAASEARRPPPPPAAPAAPAAIPLRDLLDARGALDDHERRLILRGLAERHLDALLDLHAAHPERLAALLDTEVIFTAEPTPPGPTAIYVPVLSDQRCELTNASDLKAAFDLACEQCAAAKVSQLLIVGGSPVYHRQLKQLLKDHPAAPALRMIEGDSKRSSRQARQDIRWASLVVVWGATILDHSVSNLYRHASPMISIPNRGLTGMLSTLAEKLE